MKKLSHITLLFLFCLAVQPCFSQLKLGVQAGLNGSTIHLSLEDEAYEKELSDDTKYKLGFTLGIVADYKLTGPLSLQSGISFTSKGMKYENDISSMGTDFNSIHKLNTYFLEVPVYLVYTYSGFQLQAGPYLGAGIKGNYTKVTTSTQNGQSRTNESIDKIIFKNKVSESYRPEPDVIPLRRWDYGLNLGIGYQIGNGFVRATHSRGLADTNTKVEGAETGKDKRTYRVFALSVGYYFL